MAGEHGAPHTAHTIDRVPLTLVDGEWKDASLSSGYTFRYCADDAGNARDSTAGGDKWWSLIEK